MKKLILLPLFLLCYFFSFSQSSQLFIEDFQSPTNGFTLNSGGPAPNSGNNQWIVNNQYSGAPTYPNTMPQDSTYSGTIGFAPNSKYLHIHDAPSGILNGNYNPTTSSDRFAYMTNGICTLGMDSIHFSFFYLCEGSATAYGKVYYSINNGPWIQTGLSQYNNKYKWKFEDITDVAFSNVQNLRFGFRWENNSGAAVNSESFSIDDVDIVGSYNNTTPVTIIIDSVSPNPICQGGYLFIYWHLSDTLCDGTYQISLSNAAGVFTGANNWVYNMYYPQTTSVVPIILPTTLPAGNCYKIRITRTSPPPVIVSLATACFSIISCPNVITTLQPSVTLDTNAVCVGSDIDVPFYSTGVYTTNTYTAQLSDSNGVFSSTPPVVGSMFNNTTYDPSLGSLPGMVSGQIPNVPAGCGYYIRVVSSNPVAIGAPWGPFCIGECDITTNNKLDLHFCVTDCAISPGAIDTLLDVDVNAFNTTASYLPGNIFTTQLFSMQTFAQIGANGILGSVAATGDTTLNMHIPCKDSLPIIGVPVGTNYLRVAATNSSVPDNSLGTIIRLTIGAPHGTAEIIQAYDYTTFQLRDTFCIGDVAALFFFPYNYSDMSTYKWICNGINGGNPFVSPSGANSNSLYVNLGAAGILTFKVQENSYGCLGPWSPVDTIWVFGPPVVPINGPIVICQGDTAHYSVLFGNNTYYTWGSVGGIIVDTSNNVSDITFPNVGNFQVTMSAINGCGSASTVKSITVKPYPTVNAGLDTTICASSSVSLSTPTGTSYGYSWNNGTSVVGTTATTVVSPTVNTTYIITVTGPGGCIKKDTVKVFVEYPSTALYTDSICAGGDSTITLVADTTGNYLWSTGATTQSITVNSSGTYSLGITSPGEVCPRLVTYNITNPPTLGVPFYSDSVCPGGVDNIVLIADTIGNYTWSTGATTQSISINDTGIYSLIIIVPGEFCPRMVTYNVTEAPCPTPIVLVLPNIFSPNGDGINDNFTPVLTGDFDKFDIKIFNRWGQLMFESTDPHFKWPGTTKQGKAAPDGTYYFIANTSLDGKDNAPMKDYVTLTR
ncbi:MAG: gliding motility-associated C-terminal domain-containing protein [Bacteroidia bacterium]|nr:gliding motility-associated C-terminal domain-containing protein [Bacteroidia bacterium]